ncbi:DUF134 domain-containing protein [Thermoanaerobacterium sp. DL9XJH110]|uniref:DUF134 domain-containing protein n=1 Tax=Thermoanaerobacterium sp. DL9XJH110 TaxID=3386643 RepID=UPI003BB5736E
MPRPPKWRRVEFLPDITYFKPAGVPLRQLEEVILTVEELEAIRLKDQEGLEQEECAARMGISRPTFFRIINSARSKVAEALVKGKAIRIEGGNFRISWPVRCKRCGHVWRESGKPDMNQDYECPECHSREWVPAGNHRGWCHGRRRRGPFDYVD